MGPKSVIAIGISEYVVRSVFVPFMTSGFRRVKFAGLRSPSGIILVCSRLIPTDRRSSAERFRGKSRFMRGCKLARMREDSKVYRRLVARTKCIGPKSVTFKASDRAAACNYINTFSSKVNCARVTDVLKANAV